MILSHPRTVGFTTSWAMAIITHGGARRATPGQGPWKLGDTSVSLCLIEPAVAAGAKPCTARYFLVTQLKGVADLIGKLRSEATLITWMRPRGFGWHRITWTAAAKKHAVISR